MKEYLTEVNDNNVNGIQYLVTLSGNLDIDPNEPVYVVPKGELENLIKIRNACEDNKINYKKKILELENEIKKYDTVNIERILKRHEALSKRYIKLQDRFDRLQDRFTKRQDEIIELQKMIYHLTKRGFFSRLLDRVPDTVKMDGTQNKISSSKSLNK
ncbi:MAG: hypothetical protein QME14_04070 [Methanobacteriaceae archaeon]|nr:hypothetical protein [Methanobacteriaceae archaeon]